MVGQEGKGVPELLGYHCKTHICSSPITDDVSELLGYKRVEKGP